MRTDHKERPAKRLYDKRYDDVMEMADYMTYKWSVGAYSFKIDPFNEHPDMNETWGDQRPDGPDHMEIAFLLKRPVYHV